MSIKLFKISAIYLLLGILLGMYMSITENFSLTSIHVHILLLGWGTFGIIGLGYHLFPILEQDILAIIHFWLHNIGLPVMMISLILYLNKQPQFEPGIVIGSIAVTIGIILFVINVFKNLKPSVT